MTTTIRKHLLLAAQITIVLAQVSGLIFAAVSTGFAQEPSALAATGFSPVTECATEYRNEMRAHAGIAVTETRDNALLALDARLQNNKASDAQLEET